VHGACNAAALLTSKRAFKPVIIDANSWQILLAHPAAQDDTLFYIFELASCNTLRKAAFRRAATKSSIKAGQGLAQL
jgi:hypothetical protein